MIKIVTYYYDYIVTYYYDYIKYRNYNCKCYKSHNLEPNWQTAYHTKEIKMSQWQFVDKKIMITYQKIKSWKTKVLWIYCMSREYIKNNVP